jgi:hypothetical protein
MSDQGHVRDHEMTEEEIREGLVRGLWADYQKPEVTPAQRLKIATLLEELTADE